MQRRLSSTPQGYCYNKNMQKQKFPSYNGFSGELSIVNTNTPMGLYYYRYHSYDNLLGLSERGFNGRDFVNDENLGFFRDSALHLACPLGAIILGMHIVAFEDYVRQQVLELMNNAELLTLYPQASSKLRTDNRGDYVKMSNLTCFNKNFSQAFNFFPMEAQHIPRIHDLVNIRNIIFHFGGIVNQKKREQFSFYEIDRNVIDPSYDGIREISRFVLERVSYMDKQIRINILKTIRDRFPINQKDNSLLKQMIVNLNYFGYLPEQKPGIDMDAHRLDIQDELLEKCLSDVALF